MGVENEGERIVGGRGAGRPELAYENYSQARPRINLETMVVGRSHGGLEMSRRESPHPARNHHYPLSFARSQQGAAPSSALHRTVQTSSNFPPEDDSTHLFLPEVVRVVTMHPTLSERTKAVKYEISP